MKPFHLTTISSLAMLALGLKSDNRLFIAGGISHAAYLMATTAIPVDVLHPFNDFDELIKAFTDGAAEDETVVLADGIAFATLGTIVEMDKVRATYFRTLYGTLDDTIKAFAPDIASKLEHLPKVIAAIDKQIVILDIASTATHLTTLDGDSAGQFDDLSGQIERFVASSTVTEIAHLSERIFASVKGAVPAMSMFAAQRLKSVHAVLNQHIASKDDTGAAMGMLTETRPVVTLLDARIAELDTGGQGEQLEEADGERKVA